MQHTAPMRIGDGPADRSQQLGGFSRGEGPIGEPLRQRGPFDQLHAEEWSAFDLSDLIQRHDVRVMKLRRRFRLRTESCEVHRRRQVTAQHHLQRDDPVEALVPRFVHDPHAAASEFRQQLVVAAVAGQHARRATRFRVGRPV